MPDPTSPQNFNRYSYCLNNPLKYIDPSGNEVDFGIDPSADYLSVLAAYQRVAKLIEAWYKLKEIAPELTKELEDSEEVIQIRWADLPGNRTGQSLDGAIEIDTRYKDSDVNKMLRTLAHESFHQIANIHGFTSNSRYEEAIAFSIGRAVERVARPVYSWIMDNIFERKDDLSPSMSKAEVDHYLNQDWIWENYNRYVSDFINVGGSYKLGPPNIYPRDSEGGYEAMRELYMRFFPDN